MIITGAFFCEAARTYEGKLNVLGGVWDWYWVDDVSTSPVCPMTLVALTQRETDGANESPMTITIRDPSGATIGRIDGQVHFGGPSILGFLIVPINLRVQSHGRFVFEIVGSSGVPTVVGLNVAPTNRDHGPDAAGS